VHSVEVIFLLSEVLSANKWRSIMLGNMNVFMAVLGIILFSAPAGEPADGPAREGSRSEPKRKKGTRSRGLLLFIRNHHKTVSKKQKKTASELTVKCLHG